MFTLLTTVDIHHLRFKDGGTFAYFGSCRENFYFKFAQFIQAGALGLGPVFVGGLTESLNVPFFGCLLCFWFVFLF